jgi:hypothetical protein
MVEDSYIFVHKRPSFFVVELVQSPGGKHIGNQETPEQYLPIKKTSCLVINYQNIS